jgi:hypothetical protein
VAGVATDSAIILKSHESCEVQKLT